MIVVVLALLLVVSVPLMGANLGRLRAISLHAGWLPLVAVLLQTLAVDGPLSTLAVAPLIMHVLSYGLAVAFLWLNRSVPGLGMIGAGGLANLAAIAFNGGVMPATATALATAGIQQDGGFANSAVSSGSPLWFLGDVFAIPQGWPFANVFSAGDIVLLIGLAVLLHRCCRAADRAVPVVAA